MKFKIFLKKLEKKKVITKWPPPIIPFILLFICLLLIAIVYYLEFSCFYKQSLIALSIFTLIYAILHSIVRKILMS